MILFLCFSKKKKRIKKGGVRVLEKIHSASGVGVL
jgi:hypothetical protein